MSTVISQLPPNGCEGLYILGGNDMKADVLIVGTGCSGLYLALNLPQDNNIIMITKSDCKSSDSFLAQGGMCMLKDA